MPFAVRTPGGGVVLLVDLPISKFEPIEQETGLLWGQVVRNPTITAKCAQAVYKLACAEQGVEPVELTPRLIAGTSDDDAIFWNAPDDLPTVYEDGLPKAEDETPTSG